ncbi:MAG: hypothetical protein SGPRY_000200, partial [Prymnesium sp.]
LPNTISGTTTPDVEGEPSPNTRSEDVMKAFALAKSKTRSEDPTHAEGPALTTEPWYMMPESSLLPVNDEPSASPKGRTVADLQPRPAITVGRSATVEEAAKVMATAREDAVLVVASDTGMLLGILTDSDVGRKVVARGLDPRKELVVNVMTSSPSCVLTHDDALSALSLMIEHRFRHLPVLTPPAPGLKEARVAGVLDVARCMYDAISWLETATMRGEFSQLRVTLAKRTEQVLERGVTPHLRSSGASVTVDVGASVQEAAGVMAARRGAVVVSSESQSCAGILTPKDLLFKVVASGINAATARVEDYMTPDPTKMRGTDSAVQVETCCLACLGYLDALLSMQRGNYRNVPVVNDEGKPLGVLDVLALLDGALLIGHENSGDNGAEGDQQVAIKVVWGKTTLLVQETDKFIEKVYAGLIASETRGLVPDMKDMGVSKQLDPVFKKVTSILN